MKNKTKDDKIQINDISEIKNKKVAGNLPEETKKYSECSKKYLNCQDIFVQFKEHHKALIKRDRKDDQSRVDKPIKTKIADFMDSIEFCNSIPIIILGIVGICLLIHAFNVKGGNEKEFYILISRVFLLISVNSIVIYIPTTFTNKEIELANEALNEVICEIGIKNKSGLVKKLIEYSYEIDNGNRVLKALSKTKVYPFLISIFLFGSGILSGYLISEISKMNFDEVIQILYDIIAILLSICIWILIYYVIFNFLYGSIERERLLYIQTLKNIELTLDYKEDVKE